jgi:hypothetical protein
MSGTPNSLPYSVHRLAVGVFFATPLIGASAFCGIGAIRLEKRACGGAHPTFRSRDERAACSHRKCCSRAGPTFCKIKPRTYRTFANTRYWYPLQNVENKFDRVEKEIVEVSIQVSPNDSDGQVPRVLAEVPVMRLWPRRVISTKETTPAEAMHFRDRV